ncbi:hypothetical protein BRC68_04820 [Halobacteriales archaeon QH_6_64_20]|nr:MAG: hypothetical protein BRC68_04820 [Halobacteriales archaeon QH_6_64_20]
MGSERWIWSRSSKPSSSERGTRIPRRRSRLGSSPRPPRSPAITPWRSRSRKCSRTRSNTPTVADDGPGAPDEPEGSAVGMAEHGSEGGAGMGLFLVRSVVDRYGGDVGVTDNDPTGALFSLRFPTA